MQTEFHYFEIIDCHVHPFLTSPNNTSWFPGTDTPESFFAELERAGISRCCGSVIRKLANPSFEDIKALNRETIELKNRFPKTYIPGINVHGNYPEESCREIELLHKTENIRWIGELVAYFMDYSSYSTPAMFQIFDLAQNLDLPVNIHPGDFNEMAKICTAFPKLKVVVAHPSDGKDNMLARFELVKKYPNAYLDLSGSGVFRWGMLRQGLNMAGKDKFLFGSDFPICNPSMMIQGIMFEHLSDSELEAVFSGNFKRLTGIQ
ncbi:MAG: amidohydrolase family protein [Victivallaceae bacterium]